MTGGSLRRVDAPIFGLVYDGFQNLCNRPSIVREELVSDLGAVWFSNYSDFGDP